MAHPPRPVMLVILDGFGWREAIEDNAVRLARAPTFTGLWQSCPHAFLHTSGRDVGLPDGQMGNSEVGHMNIGAESGTSRARIFAPPPHSIGHSLRPEAFYVSQISNPIC
jgi:bisphosphoglycerate-independent phosphoglycerate mutase (AlkP superfamily)